MKHHEHVSRNLSRVTARAGANENGSDDGQKYDDWGMPAATGERREGRKHGGPVGSTVSHEKGAKKRLDRHMRGHKPGGNRDHKAEGGPTDSGAVNQLMTDAADKALTGYAKGGAVKKGKGTNITIMVGSPGGAPAAAVPPPPIGVPPGPPPPPVPPMGGPPGPPMGGPPGMPPGGGAPPGGGLPPQLAAALAARGGMGRAKGGRVGKFDAGAGSGEGRLEKIEWEKDYLKKGKK